MKYLAKKHVSHVGLPSRRSFLFDSQFPPLVYEDHAGTTVVAVSWEFCDLRRESMLAVDHARLAVVDSLRERLGRR